MTATHTTSRTTTYTAARTADAEQWLYELAGGSWCAPKLADRHAPPLLALVKQLRADLHAAEHARTLDAAAFTAALDDAPRLVRWLYRRHARTIRDRYDTHPA